MDLSKIKKLSDNQLIKLYRNENTALEIKKAIVKELDSRDLKDETLKTDPKIYFTQTEKLTLILSPFFMSYHKKNMLNNFWSREKDKKFWYYITLGYALYAFIVLFFGYLIGFRN